MQFCCPPGSWPALGEAASAGKIIALPSKNNSEPSSSIQCYVAGEEFLGKTTRAVIACPDLFGIESGRSKLVCDTFASELKCPVIMPDYIGDVCAPDFMSTTIKFIKFVWWCFQHNTAFVVDRHKTFVANYLAQNKLTKLATISFCFGSFHAVSLAQAFPDVFTWGLVGYHPTLRVIPLANPVFGPNMEKLLSGIRSPVLFGVANDDPDHVKPNGDGEKYLREKAKQETVITVYTTMRHGFVNRGDVKDPAVRDAVEAALKEGISFLGTRGGA